MNLKIITVGLAIWILWLAAVARIGRTYLTLLDARYVSRQEAVLAQLPELSLPIHRSPVEPWGEDGTLASILRQNPNVGFIE